MDHVDILSHVLQALEITYQPFHESGVWPIHQYVDDRLYRASRVHLWKLFNDRALPSGLFRQSYPYALQEKVKLTILGITHCPDSEADLALFIQALQWLVAQRLAFEPSPTEFRNLQVSADAFRSAMSATGVELTPRDLQKVGDLLMGEPLQLGGSPEYPDGNWTFLVAEQILEFEKCRSVDGYLRRLEELYAPTNPVVQAVDLMGLDQVLASAPGQSYTVATDVQDNLMPFGESWSPAIHGLIVEACVVTDDAIRVQRADDIAAPGRITDQIIEAIIGADAIVADLTGHNANVMYEVGYAHALKKPVILLNQFLDDPPFDIKDMRQIKYSESTLPAAKSKLIAALKATLNLGDGS